MQPSLIPVRSLQTAAPADRQRGLRKEILRGVTQHFGAQQLVVADEAVPLHLLCLAGPAADHNVDRILGASRVEALHAARDRLTPPFAHRHSYEEVIGWFRAAQYDDLELLRDEQSPESVPESYKQNVGIRGFRRAICSQTNGSVI